jgi:glutaredoxin 3
MEEKKHKVIIYSTPTCHFCHKLKDYLKEKNVAFEDFDVSKDREKAMEMIKKTNGGRGVPVIDIDGTVLIGFNKEKVNELLGL